MPVPLLFLQHKNEEHQHISHVTLYYSIRKHVFCLSAEITNRTKKNHNIITIKIVTKKSWIIAQVQKYNRGFAYTFGFLLQISRYLKKIAGNTLSTLVTVIYPYVNMHVLLLSCTCHCFTFYWDYFIQPLGYFFLYFIYSNEKLQVRTRKKNK